MGTISARAAATVAIPAILGLLCWFAIGCGGDEEQVSDEQVVEATLEAYVSEIAATRAAERPPDTATAAAAASPVSTPTAVVVPTPTTMVAPTPGQESATIRPAQADSAPIQDTLEPLPVSDLESFLAGVPASERACLSEAVAPDRLPVLLDSPESATDAERRAMVGCLGYDTELRLFLTPILTATGPLSPESTACLRSSFADTDLGALMLAATGDPGGDTDPGAAMALAMVSSMVSLGCLNESEFQSAGPAVGAGDEEYETFQCVLDHVGGPEKLADLLHVEGGSPAPLFEAAFECQVQVSGSPPG